MKRAGVVLLSVGLVLSSGCFSFQRRAEFSETPRLEVSFENAAAAAAFHRAFDATPMQYSDWKFTVSPLMLVNVELVLYEREWYNSLVRRADINRDGVITEEEAGLLAPPGSQGDEQQQQEQQDVTRKAVSDTTQ